MYNFTGYSFTALTRPDVGGDGDDAAGVRAAGHGGQEHRDGRGGVGAGRGSTILTSIYSLFGGGAYYSAFSFIGTLVCKDYYGRTVSRIFAIQTTV